MRKTFQQAKSQVVANQRRRSSDKHLCVVPSTILVANIKTNGLKLLKTYDSSLSCLSDPARMHSKSESKKPEGKAKVSEKTDAKKRDGKPKPTGNENLPVSTLPPIKCPLGSGALRRRKINPKKTNKH